MTKILTAIAFFLFLVKVIDPDARADKLSALSIVAAAGLIAIALEQRSRRPASGPSRLDDPD